MKNLFRLALLAALALSASAAAAQQKFGIINSQELISLMPELDSVQIKLQAVSAELQEQLETIQVEYNQKIEAYTKAQATLTESVRQLRERELQELSNRFDSFRQTAQQDIMREQQNLMAPVTARAENAIKKVGTDGGYLIIFDQAAGPTVYVNEASVVNVLSAVKKELGIPENATPRGAAAELAQ